MDLGNISICKGEFEECVNGFLDKLEKDPVPTFFLIDPFGFSSIKYETLNRIMKIPKTEILLNFMYNAISRFITYEGIEQTLTDLFGCETWKQCRDHSGKLKEQEVVNLFRKNLKKFSNYVYQYSLSFQDKNRTYYYLFHMTNNLKGCSIMKSAFAKINFGEVKFLGPNQPNPNQLCLINKSDNKIESAKNYLIKNYAGKTITFEDLVQENIDKTEFLESHIKSAVKNLENSHLQIQRVGKTEKGKIRTNKGVKEQDIITFNKELNLQTKLF